MCHFLKQRNSRAQKNHLNHLKIHAFMKTFSSSLYSSAPADYTITNLYLTFSYGSLGKCLGVFDHKADLSFLSWFDDTNLHISNKTCCRRTNLFFCGEKKMSQSESSLNICSFFKYLYNNICIVIDSAGWAIYFRVLYDIILYITII